VNCQTASSQRAAATGTQTENKHEPHRTKASPPSGQKRPKISNRTTNLGQKSCPGQF